MAKRTHSLRKLPVGSAKSMIPLCAVLLFLTVCLCALSTVKTTALICIILAFVGGGIGFKRLCERFTLPMIALGLFVLIGGISTFYAVSGKFALQEFLKLLISFCLAVFMLSVVPGKDAAPARRIASVLEGFTAIAGLVSIDMISTRIISGVVMGLLGLFSDNYPADATGLEVGIRINSIFQNPNVFGSIVGLGVILALSLVISSDNAKERAGHAVCLYLNALSFLLAFSMGSIAFIAVAFLLYLLLEQPTRRADLFILMVETLLLTLVSTALIAMTSFTVWTGIRPTPILCAVLGAAALCLTDRFVGCRLGSKLAAHGKALTVTISAVLAAAVAFALLAYNLTGPVTLGAGESLRRSAYPVPGIYDISAQADDGVNVTIQYQNQVDTMMHTETKLYSGPLSDAKFIIVPEDSLVVYFTFSAPNGAHIESVTGTGDESFSVPLGYKLLPSFIANRLQGLWANENAIQRTVFFDDGMKIFARSPIFGLGLGSYENGIMSVQSFFYETKYAHNHYIQTLAETGIVGLVSFLLMLAVSAAAVVFDRRKKESAHVMTPALGAALAFIAGHAIMEVTFSYYAYLPIAFAVIALIALCCGDSIPLPKLSAQNLRHWIVLGYAALTVVFTCFLLGNITANNTIDAHTTMENLEKAAKSDKFEYADHMLSYVVNAEKFLDDAEIQANALEFAQQLSKMNSNTIPYYLASYYFSIGDPETAMAMLEKYLRYVASDNTAWYNAFNLAITNYSSSPAYAEGMVRIVDFMHEWNENNLGVITLDERHESFLLLLGIGKES